MIHLVYLLEGDGRAVLRRAYSTRDLAEAYATRKNKDGIYLYFVSSFVIHE